MIPDEQFEKIAAVYVVAKALDPRLPPKPEMEVLETWCSIVFSDGADYSSFTLASAVSAYYEQPRDRPISPGALKAECRKSVRAVVARLTPEEREQLDYQQDLRLKERGFAVDLDWYKPEARKLGRNMQALISELGWAQRAIE